MTRQADTETALLNAIASNPDDDTPRLIYADYLQEHGEEDRAAFVRAQVAASRLPAGDGERVRLYKEGEAALDRNRRSWQHALRRLVGVYAGIHWERGVITVLQPTTLDLFLRKANRIFLTVPTITELDLSRSRIGPAEARALAACPHLARLKSLDLSWNPLGATGAAVLAESEHLARLKCLNLSRAGIADGGARALADSRHLAPIRINLSVNGIGYDGVKALAGCPRAAALESLDLSGNPILAGGALVIAESPYLTPAAKVSALRSAGYDGLAEQVEIRGRRTLSLPPH